MMSNIATNILTNILSSIVYDVGKKGIERGVYSATKKELSEHFNANCQNLQYEQSEVKETLNSLLENQQLLFNMLLNLLNEFEMKTTINIYNNQITFNVPASDIFKLQQLCCGTDVLQNSEVEANTKEYSLIDALSTIPDEKEIINMINGVKKHFIIAEPIKPKSIMFDEWYKSKCGKEAFFFEITQISYYSINRSMIYEKIKHDPRIYIIKNDENYNYTYYEVIENQALSDGNTIVVKPDINKGYIVIVSGTLS